MKRKLMIALVPIVIVFALVIAILEVSYHHYSYQEIVGSTVSDQETISEATKAWFNDYIENLKGWQVPFDYRVRNASILGVEVLEEDYVQIDYNIETYSDNTEIVENLSLISIGLRYEYNGQLVLKWENNQNTWTIVDSMMPVQYQIQNSDFNEENQTVHYSLDLDKEETYYIREGVLYVTYDNGNTLIEVPNGYEQVCRMPNDSYNENLADNSYIISAEFTAFVGYQSDQIVLLYSVDQGNTWLESAITAEGYHANTFVSESKDRYYVTIAIDKALGNEYYVTYVSSDLNTWEILDIDSFYSTNLDCIYFSNENIGYISGNNLKYYIYDGEIEEMTLEEPIEVVERLGYNPYDTISSIYEENNILYMVVSQGDDADYMMDGHIMKALYMSSDGRSFTFVEEIYEIRQVAG